MTWTITSFPSLTTAKKEQIHDYAINNVDKLNAAREDTFTYGPQAAFGNLSALWLYSQALSKIESIEDGFRELYTTEVIWDDGRNQYIGYYLQYMITPGYEYIFDDYIKFGRGTDGDDNDILSNKWSGYTIYYYGGDDNVQVGDGGHLVQVNLGSGDDYFKGNIGNESAYGEDGNDLIYGGVGKDELNGGKGNDEIYGGDDWDLIYGGDGDDAMTGGVGDDFIDGGNGSNDIAYYMGDRNEYVISTNDNNLFTVEHLSESGDGLDILVNVESIAFADKSLAFPSDIILSNYSFNNGITAASTIANLSATDADTGDIHTYSLVSGSGDRDNSAFTIDGTQLKINASPDYETQDSYSVRLQTKDSGGLTFEKSFTLSVKDINESPTELSVSASIFDENIADGSPVATLSSTDPDSEDTHTYSLVSGTGDTDNNAFRIDGDQLIIKDSPDYETKSSYAIRLKTTDSGGAYHEESTTLSVNNIIGTKADPITGETFSLDVDGDREVTALGDGLMIIRKLIGPAFADDALTNKARSNTATRSTQEIHDFIEQGISDGVLDVDGDGEVTALGDGLMVIRKLIGPAFDGDALTNKAMSSNSEYFGQENASDLIAANIDNLNPFI